MLLLQFFWFDSDWMFCVFICRGHFLMASRIMRCSASNRTRDANDSTNPTRNPPPKCFETTICIHLFIWSRTALCFPLWFRQPVSFPDFLTDFDVVVKTTWTPEVRCAKWWDGLSYAGGQASLGDGCVGTGLCCRMAIGLSLCVWEERKVDEKAMQRLDLQGVRLVERWVCLCRLYCYLALCISFWVSGSLSKSKAVTNCTLGLKKLPSIRARQNIGPYAWLSEAALWTSWWGGQDGSYRIAEESNFEESNIFCSKVACGCAWFICCSDVEVLSFFIVLYNVVYGTVSGSILMICFDSSVDCCSKREASNQA